MNIHHNARLTFRGRELLVKRIVEQGLRVEEAAQASGVSVRTAYKWLMRYRQEGITGLYDRSSRPRHCPHQTSAHRHQSLPARTSGGSAAPGHQETRAFQASGASGDRQSATELQAFRLGVRARRHRRRVSDRLQQRACRRDWTQRMPGTALCAALLTQPWDHPQAHQTLHTAYQRQGRAVHPDCVA